jgi:hypothetical protein
MGGTIMGKRYFVVVFIVFLGLFAFADTGEQEEIDFLLFLPNSAEKFVEEERAKIQLDNIAKYVLDKKPDSGQIHVYGYTADVVNDIDSVDLSKARALLVINELLKRGMARELFSDPVAYGPVDLWGDNIDENDRIPNRRVRIVLDGTVLTPAVLATVEPVVEPEIIITRGDDGETVKRESTQDKSDSKFPWIILLLLLALAAFLFLLSKLKRKNRTTNPASAKPAPAEPRVIHASPPPASVIAPLIIPAPPDESVTTSEMKVNLDEEIRFRAYELYLLRYGQNEDEVNDWYRAVTEICGRYDASGYQTYKSDGSWWAKKTMVLQKKALVPAR